MDEYTLRRGYCDEQLRDAHHRFLAGDNYVLSLIVANPNNDITSPDQLTIAYYASESDALLELNQLPNQYTSETPDAQILYLRVERDNDCFGINSMLLQVVPVPVYNEVLDEILCTYTPGSFDV